MDLLSITMRTRQHKSVHHLLKTQAEKNPKAIAIMGPDRSSMDYARLLSLVENTVKWLNSAGFGKNDRIAVVLPNGAEMASASLSVSSCATCAPLNPTYSYHEFDFYLADLNPKSLLIQSGMDSAAVEVAKTRGIPIIELSPRHERDAGLFTLKCCSKLSPVDTYFAGPDDIALVLHTSGTTSRPKIIPLTHANICTSAENTQASLSLTEKDRSLNVMPLFHVHGLIGSLLSSLSAGASVVLTQGFNAPRFFDWIEEFKPTWWTAVPTMHASILSRADDNPEIISHHSLRFIRSCSSALPVQLMSHLEKTFGVPVIEAYGMTEASHQISSNPLPPSNRKAGSVGLAAGPEVAIMGEHGTLLPANTIGEVVIRGRNVTTGYENNPAANAVAFTNGWFRTGDQGTVDAEGYLSLTGRLKEIINRGGEKVALREIDEVLLNHPGVRQAVAFAVRHPTLGEDVAAAVVPKDGQVPSEVELREFALKHLSASKVPSRIIMLTEIPKGPTGKLQRIGLAERLAKELAVPYEPPVEGLEQLAATTVEQVLQLQRVGRNDNFFALGGDSIRAMQVVTRLIKALGVEIPPTALFRRPTPALLATELARLQEEQEIESLAAELQKLPPEEAARLLKEASGGNP
jgi:oxalate---CoA ligase